VNRIHLPHLSDDPSTPFPPTSEALERPNGLLAWGGGVEPERLLAAYRLGIFPWYTENEPVLWWSPAPRCVIFPADVHFSRRTRRRYRSGNFTLTADTAFDEVIGACATPRKADSGTWITAELRHAFSRLHQMGFAHSVEVWSNRTLVGGIYGLALGRVFFGESMFSRETDTSKIALVSLCRQLEAWGFELLDCQVSNPHLLSMGAVLLSRDEFEDCLRSSEDSPVSPGPWTATFGVSRSW